MAKKRAAKKAAPATKKTAKQAPAEQVYLDPPQDKALRLVDKSAKVRAELEQAVTAAAAKAVRKLMKDHNIPLTPAQADLLTAIWFSD
jgi:16S rRNA G966 N2-methylase RsmD